ncbi:hypothetical protein [Luteolibacter soli]|uniref:Uncharacterized protein n=1 Tax=Luteolibacter soli TaxID=3135280 RepID=A0ABU9B1Q1_9BACT
MNQEPENTMPVYINALSDEPDRRYFVEKFVSDYPGTTASQVVTVLENAPSALGSAPSQEELEDFVKEAIGITTESQDQ